MYQKTNDKLKKDACMSIYGLNPHQIVTCDVTPPATITNVHESDSNSDEVITIPESQITPPPTPTIRCMSNHRGSADMIRICDLLQCKVDRNLKLLKMNPSVSIQVEFSCSCNN